jgi:hypothetical protein
MTEDKKIDKKPNSPKTEPIDGAREYFKLKINVDPRTGETNDDWLEDIFDWVNE